MLHCLEARAIRIYSRNHKVIVKCTNKLCRLQSEHFDKLVKQVHSSQNDECNLQFWTLTLRSGSPNSRLFIICFFMVIIYIWSSLMDSSKELRFFDPYAMATPTHHLILCSFKRIGLHRPICIKWTVSANNFRRILYDIHNHIVTNAIDNGILPGRPWGKFRSKFELLSVGMFLSICVKISIRTLWIV